MIIFKTLFKRAEEVTEKGLNDVLRYIRKYNLGSHVMSELEEEQSEKLPPVRRDVSRIMAACCKALGSKQVKEYLHCTESALSQNIKSGSGVLYNLYELMASLWNNGHRKEAREIHEFLGRFCGCLSIKSPRENIPREMALLESYAEFLKSSGNLTEAVSKAIQDEEVDEEDLDDLLAEVEEAIKSLSHVKGTILYHKDNL